MKRAFLLPLLALAGLAALVAVGCASDAPGASDAPTAGATAGATEAATGALDFPTGPATVVEAGYAPPEDRVPSTGAYLPANGKPTLVYVDAIW